MEGGVIYNLLPVAKGSYQLLIDQWVVAPILILGVLILFWRHATLAYGDIKFAQGWRMLGAILILMATPYLFGMSIGNNAIIQLILIILMMDRFVNSLSVRRSTFYVFDVGFIIGLLSMIHPAYLFLLPFFIYKFCQLEICSVPHVVAQVLGVVTVWLLLIFLFAQPSMEGVTDLLYLKIKPLLQPQVPRLSDFPILFGLVIFLATLMLMYYWAYRGSIVRVRYLYRSHFEFAFLLLVLQAVFSSSKGFLVLGFMVSILFFASSPAFYFTSVREGKKKYLVMFYLISAIVFILELWSGRFFSDFKDFSFFSSCLNF